jgi:hypothetical protein
MGPDTLLDLAAQEVMNAPRTATTTSHWYLFSFMVKSSLPLLTLKT